MSRNELDRAASPYLLQHKDNPVHWMEWGEPALALARASHKPILLSVGYAACHWCHVMAHESFEDVETAAVMNRLFVNIKVDREERPDVDHFYMTALQALGQRGGWPLTMVLAPDGAPIWGGTYFPNVARHGQPSFVAILGAVADAFQTQPEAITRTKAALLGIFGEQIHADGRESTALSLEALDKIAASAAAAMDPVNGGLGTEPKFPNASLIELLLRAGRRTGISDYTELAILTLRRIAQGGIYDHVGGGFARYAVDAHWLVPHFEKMLYDNAQLIELLALAYRETGEAMFKTRAADTVGWLRREMMTDGVLAASLDADSEHVEGKFYVWTKAEVDAVLGPDAALFCRAYDVTEEGNWRDDHRGQSVTILNRLDTPQLEPGEEVLLPALCEQILQARADRIRPARDDKILTDWNALSIAAMARASSLCGEPAWLEDAQRLYDRIVSTMGVPDRPGRLVHARRAERRGNRAFASDYAAMSAAALSLAEHAVADVSRASGFIDQARTWLGILEQDYAGPESLLFMTTDKDRDIPVRLAPLADEATPNANGVYAASLIRMAAISGEDRYRGLADRVLAAAASPMLAYPLGHCALLNALDRSLSGREIVLAGPRIEALAHAALQASHLDRVVTSTALQPHRTVARDQERLSGEGAAFVCQASSCSPPLRDAAGLSKVLAAYTPASSAGGIGPV